MLDGLPALQQGGLDDQHVAWTARECSLPAPGGKKVQTQFWSSQLREDQLAYRNTSPIDGLHHLCLASNCNE